MGRLSAEQKALMELQREAWRHQRRMARLSAFRDVGASLAQASASNPMVTQVAAGFLGASCAALSQFSRRARMEAVRAMPNDSPARRLLTPGTTLGQGAFETFGEGLMAFAGARATVDGIANLVSAFRPDTQSTSLAFDLSSPGVAWGDAHPLAGAPATGRRPPGRTGARRG